MKLSSSSAILLWFISSVWSFVPPTTLHNSFVKTFAASDIPPNSFIAQQQQPQQGTSTGSTSSRYHRVDILPQIQKQRKSVASVQMQGLFGLGFGEIAVIVVVVGFVLGPQNIGRLLGASAKQASAIKDELSRVPEEFQKGLEEGEADARARKARVIKAVPKEKEDA